VNPVGTMVEVSVGSQYEPVPTPRAKFEIPKFFRFFVEDLIADALAVAAGNGPELEVPAVDWWEIWTAGNDESSLEQALGKIAAAAFLAANRISGGAEERYSRVQEDYLARLAESWASPSGGAATGLEVAIPTGSPAVPMGIIHTYELRDDPEVEELPLDEGIANPSTRHLPVTINTGWFTGYTWVRNIGAVIIFFAVWQLWGTSISQHHEQHQLQGEFAASVQKHHAAPATSSGPVLIPASESVPVPAEGSPVAKIEIPKLALDEIVVSGTAEADLAKGPGHYVGTAVPGQAGNVAIAGHRTTNGAPFNELGQLAIGDKIYLTTLSGERLTYVVSQSPTPVSPSDVTVLDNFGDNRITLTTCNPEYSAAQRLIVVGELQQPNPPATKKVNPQPYRILNAQTASLNWSLLPVAVLEMGLLLLLGLSNRRFAAWYGGAARWFILIPLWGAALYIFFGTLTMFLPSSI
jgi:LPXTG-site transpeptidase (sortase) family protein